MNRHLPTRRMREHPDLDQLKRQAKELLRGFVAGDNTAVSEVNAHYPAAAPSTFALHDAQLVLARSYGFESWPKLKAYVDGVTIRRLAEAVQSDNLPLVEAMLKARPELADMEMSYGDERRPLHFAVMKRAPEMVRLLMRHGADAQQGVHPHRDATSAWILAKERGYDEIVAIIEAEEHRRAPQPGEPEEKPVGDGSERQAVAAGDINWLLARHAEGKLVNHVRWNGGGLLTVAVRHDQPEILRLLLDLGFDPDERVSSGKGDWVAYSQGYPLWYAAALGRHGMAELLLQRGADPNLHVDSSGSAVYSAFSHKQWEMVELLRHYGGIVSADTAALYRQTELARQMLAEDPRPELAEELLRFAASGGDPEIVRMAPSTGSTGHEKTRDGSDTSPSRFTSGTTSHGSTRAIRSSTAPRTCNASASSSTAATRTWPAASTRRRCMRSPPCRNTCSMRKPHPSHRRSWMPEPAPPPATTSSKARR